MRKLFFVVILCLFAAPAYSATITFEWDANPVEEQVTGYRLYQDCGGPECVVADTTETTYTMVNVIKNHAFSLTAYKIDGEDTIESEHSVYVIYSDKPTRPKRPTLRATVTK